MKCINFQFKIIFKHSFCLCSGLYTYVWVGYIKTKKEKMKQQLDLLCKYVQRLAADELHDTDPSVLIILIAKK